jgi:hypothetical protein
LLDVYVLETPHVVVGAVIATKIGNPYLALPLAFASHFVLEKVPHWNPHLNTEKDTFGKVTNKSFKIVALDSSLALASGLAIASRQLPDLGRFTIILTACLLSILPDLVEAPYFFLNKESKFIKSWIKFQKSLQVDAKPFWGIATQILTISAALLWIYG